MGGRSQLPLQPGLGDTGELPPSLSSPGMSGWPQAPHLKSSQFQQPRQQGHEWGGPLASRLPYPMPTRGQPEHTGIGGAASGQGYPPTYLLALPQPGGWELPQQARLRVGKPSRDMTVRAQPVFQISLLQGHLLQEAS